MNTYIVAPSFSISPESMQLGDIVVNPFGPELVPINRKCRHPIDAEDLIEPGIITGFSSTRKKLISGRFGLWKTFLALVGLPIGAELGLIFERGSTDLIKAGTLETYEFIATDEYVGEVLNKPNVKSYLEGRQYRVPVYMVTGLKIAKGGSVSLGQKTEAGTSGGLDRPTNVTGMEPIIQFVRNRTQSDTFDSSTDFILAFRIRRITFTMGQPKHELSLKKTSMMDGEDTIERPLARLEGAILVEQAEEEADKEGLLVEVCRDEEEKDLEWIITNGIYNPE